MGLYFKLWQIQAPEQTSFDPCQAPSPLPRNKAEGSRSLSSYAFEVASTAQLLVRQLEWRWWMAVLLQNQRSFFKRHTLDGGCWLGAPPFPVPSWIWRKAAQSFHSATQILHLSFLILSWSDIVQAWNLAFTTHTVCQIHHYSVKPEILLLSNSGKSHWNLWHAFQSK